MTGAAVILAAGAGSRLGGRAKALLRSAEVTYLERIVTTARAAGIEELVVVVGPPHGDAVRVEAARLDVRTVENPRPERGMASSVAVGFAALGAHRVGAAYLWPVDHPFVGAATLRALSTALAAHDAARPTFGGRRGHPPLVAQALWSALAACGDVDGGARTVLAAADTVDVDVDDPGVVRDVDTPEDLA